MWWPMSTGNSPAGATPPLGPSFPGLATGSGDESVGSVVCFAIAPPYRAHGVAGHLLDGAISLLWSMGFTRIEGYPVAQPSDRERAFPGSLDLFRSRGFEVVSEDPLVVALTARSGRRSLTSHFARTASSPRPNGTRIADLEGWTLALLTKQPAGRSAVNVGNRPGISSPRVWPAVPTPTST